MGEVGEILTEDIAAELAKRRDAWLENNKG